MTTELARVEQAQVVPEVDLGATPWRSLRKWEYRGLRLEAIFNGVFQPVYRPDVDIRALAPEDFPICGDLGNMCGYVSVPLAWQEQIDIEQVQEEVDAHGGITYTHRSDVEGIVTFGFDFAHASDMRFIKRSSKKIQPRGILASPWRNRPHGLRRAVKCCQMLADNLIEYYIEHGGEWQDGNQIVEGEIVDGDQPAGAAASE